MLYLFQGSDTFSRQEALKELRRELDSDGMLETNTVVLAARQTAPQEVFAACDTVPFLASHRLVIVEGLLDAAPSGARGRRSKRAEGGGEEGDAGPWQALAGYIDRMPPATTLVLNDGEVSDSHPLNRALRARGTVRKFALPDQNAAAGWVMARARKHGIKLEIRAAALLAALAPGHTISNRQYVDTWALATELDKLAAYASGGVIREADVRELVSAARESKSYELADAVAEGGAAKASKLLHDLAGQGQNTGQILSTIEGRYRRLAAVREMLDAGATGARIGEKLGQKGFGLEKLLGQAERYPLPALRQAMERIVEADADVKRGVYDDEISLELLVQDLAAMAPVSARRPRSRV